MKITVNQRCQGHARCVAFAPEAFVLDDEGYATVRPGMEHLVDDERVLKALNNCPERAIEIVED